MEWASLPKRDDFDLLIDEIISLIDVNRGEMNRLEFVSLLIRNRLEKYRKNHNYADEADLYRFIKEVMEMLSTYLEFLCKTRLSDMAAVPGYCHDKEL